MFRIAAASLLLAGSAALGASAPVAPERIPVEAELRQALAEAEAASAEQGRLEQAAAAARDDVAQLHARQLAAAQGIAAAEAQISAADAQVRLAQSRLALQRQKLAREQAPVSALLGGLALMARRPPLVLLADSGSAEDLVKLRILLRSTMPAIEAKTAALSRALERGSRLEQTALTSRQDLLRRRGELEQRREAFAKLEEEASAVAQSRGSAALGAGDVALVRDERLGDLQRQAASSSASRRLASKLAEAGPAPLPRSDPPALPPLAYRLPADARVTDGVGAVSASGVRSRGLTLATARGTPIAAPAAGTVLFAGPFRDYDGVLIIDHGRGWKSVLVNAGSELQRGARVRIGDRIGTALGPLEVQLQHNGEPVSPAIIAGSSAMVSNARKGG